MSFWLALSISYLLLIVSSCVSLSYTQHNGGVSQDLVLTLDEEFDTFNLSLWKHELTLSGGGNWEFEGYYNNRSNSYVKNGVLYIKPTLLEDQIGIDNLRNGFTMDIWGGSPADLCTENSFYGCLRTSGAGGNYLNPVRSARLRTAESFYFKYGRVEVKAKLPKGDWLWPAIWMLPRYDSYGNWPSSGEIDIMESRGNSPDYPPGGYDTFGSTLHWGIDWQSDFYAKTHATKKVSDLADNFHIYGLVWNASYIGTYLDDETNMVLSYPITDSFWSQTGYQSPPWDNPWVGRGNDAPFDQEFYLIINLACGGTTGYWPEGNGKPWSNTDPHAVNQFYDAKAQWYSTWKGEDSALQVESVKVWTYVPEGQEEVVRDTRVSSANGVQCLFLLMSLLFVIAFLMN